MHHTGLYWSLNDTLKKNLKKLTCCDAVTTLLGMVIEILNQINTSKEKPYTLCVRGINSKALLKNNQM